MKKVLITGVHKGLGVEMAQRHLAQGVHVYGISRMRPKKLFDESRFSFLSLDLSSPQQIVSPVLDFIAHAGILDLVLLNAGMLGPIQRMEQAEGVIQSAAQAAALIGKIIVPLQAVPSGSAQDVRQLPFSV